MEAPKDLKAHGLVFLDYVSNGRDFDRASEMIHPSCEFIHDDQSPKTREQFIAYWPKMLASSPHFDLTVRDVICEGNKVWVFSKIGGRADGTSCDDLHMLEFDAKGLCVKSHGVQRTLLQA